MRGPDLELVRLKRKLMTALPGRRGSTPLDFDLHVVSNAEMERLRRALRARRDFRGAEARKIAKEEMVNVLSFPEPPGFPHPETRARWLGEVYVNRDYARRAPGTLPFLLVHGVLHLLGYRHDTLRDTMRMEALEKKLCRALGVPHGIEPLN